MSSMEIKLLKIRSLISDKEMVTAIANKDTTRGGEWLGDYCAWHAEIDRQINGLINEIEREGAA